MTNDLGYTIDQDIEAYENQDRIELYQGYKIEAEDPYGHFRIKVITGRLPDDFRGTYTNAAAARLAIDRYLSKPAPTAINDAHRVKLGLKPAAETKELAS